MESLESYIQQDFNTQRQQWENSLKNELKLAEVGNKDQKKLSDGSIWPTLSLKTPQEVALSVEVTWKKASQSYASISESSMDQLSDDLEAGVRVFFFYKEVLSDKIWSEISEMFYQHPKREEVEVFLLGSKKITSSKTGFKTFDERDLFMAREIHDEGGNNIQELGLIAFKLTQNLNKENFHFATFLDSHFFKNIAKVRALKLLVHKIFSEAQIKKSFYITGLTSMREWTLFERYSNMLRNNASVASGFIAGADFVQSSGYENLHLIEGVSEKGEHIERSLRMARNSSHILALESMLGMVHDAAYGSFHLESLTQHYAQEAWTFMQKLLSLKDDERDDFLHNEVSKVRANRQILFRTRKHVLTGINDFPDVKEVSTFNPGKEVFFRVGREFETLRLQMNKQQNKPKVYIALFGDYAALNARVNFVKNYFELLGLEVFEPHKGTQTVEEFQKECSQRKEDIIILCSQDENYSLLADKVPSSFKEKFVAGKVELPGFTSLYAGQNVFEVLESIVSRWSKV